MVIDDFENRLKQYTINAESAVVKHLEDYSSLHDMEEELCPIINEGNTLRKYLLEHRELLDDGSYMYLSNKIHYPEVLSEKYKSMQLIILLSKNLFDAYRQYLNILLEKKDWTEIINIYDAMFKLTGSPIYKKCIADIYLKNLDNTDAAFDIYEEIKPMFAKDPDFYKNYASMYQKRGDSEHQEDCLKKMYEFELLNEANELSKNKEYDKAIEKYNLLYDKTGNGYYRLETANIYAVIYEKLDIALKIYKEQEKNLSEDLNYWYKISELYEYEKNYFQQVLSMQKAIRLELKTIGKESAQ